MAQKKKKEPQKVQEKKEEKFEWTPPDFDEREFLTKDMKGTRVLLITALFSTIAGIVAFLLTGTSWYLGVVVIIGIIVSLRYIYPLFKIDVKAIEKKAWAGNIAMFFLLSLGIWIVLMNPPFSDHTEPTLVDNHILIQDEIGNWTIAGNLNTEIHSGQSIIFQVNASDIGGIDSVEISIYKQGSTGSFVGMNNTSDSQYEYDASYTTDGSDPTVYYYIIKATDKFGNNSQTEAIQFIVNP
jgi:hypothetical protein